MEQRSPRRGMGKPVGVKSNCKLNEVKVDNYTTDFSDFTDYASGFALAAIRRGTSLAHAKSVSSVQSVD